MSARAIDDVARSQALVASELARTLALGRCWPAWLAAFWRADTRPRSPLRAQTFTPSATVGVGIQTSYQNVDPLAEASDDQFSLGPRSYLFGRNHHPQHQCHVQYRLQLCHQQHGHIGRGGTVPHIARVQRLVRPFSSTERSRQLHWSVLRQRVGRIYGWHPGRLCSRLSRPRQWRSVLGRLQGGDSQDKSLGGRIRRSFRRRKYGCHLCRPRSARFLGSRERLLPQQHLLRG